MDSNQSADLLADFVGQGMIGRVSELDDGALLDLTHAGLKRSVTSEIAREIFLAVHGAKPDHDPSVFHNLALLALKASMVEDCGKMVASLIKHRQWGAAQIIASQAVADLSPSDAARFHDALMELKRLGHFKTRFVLFGRRWKGSPILAIVLGLFFRIYFVPQVVLAVIRDRNDPRLSMLPGRLKD